MSQNIDKFRQSASQMQVKKVKPGAIQEDSPGSHTLFLYLDSNFFMIKIAQQPFPIVWKTDIA